MTQPSATTAAPIPNRISGLDGLRAIAVLAVVAYHFDAPWMPGGFLGVDLFMVLSGFLITRLLLQESDRTGRIDLPAFWVRRAKRLLPAALTLIVVVAAVAYVLFSADQLGAVRSDALAATLYVANWRFVFAKASYFDLFAEASPFRHLWSLAIEEQFYLLWPVVVVAAGRRLRRLVPVCIVMIVASAAAMMVLANDADPSRAYYGTDTRAQTLLIGCLLAMVLHGRAPSVRRQELASRLAGPLLAVAVAFFVVVDDSDRWMYRGGGFLLFALLGAALLWAVVEAGGRGWCGLLDRRLPDAIGKGSYSIYLWHWPAVVFLSPARLDASVAVTNVIRLGATAIAAAVSYRWVESPIRHRRLRGRTVGLGALGGLAVASLVVVVVTSGARAPADYFSASGAVLGATPGDTPDAGATGSTTAAVPPRVLVFGDSVAASLSDAMLAAASGAAVQMFAAPVSGCGLLPGVTLDTSTQVPYEPSRGCFEQVNAAIDAALAQVDPDVVVWISVWDAENRELDGSRIQLETAAGRAALYDLVGARVDAFADRGIRTVLVTMPPVGRSGTLPEPPSIKQDRIEAYDDVLRSYAADHGDVGLVDLSTRICPTGSPCADLSPASGAPYRPSDGIHYDGTATAEVASWIVGQVSAVVAP